MEKKWDIILNPNTSDISSTLVHELRHRFDGNLIKNPKYTKIYSNIPDVIVNPKYKGKHARYDYEKVADNTLTRFNFYRNNKLNTDEYIKGLSDEDFYNTFKEVTVDNKLYLSTPRLILNKNLLTLPLGFGIIATLNE